MVCSNITTYLLRKLSFWQCIPQWEQFMSTSSGKPFPFWQSKKLPITKSYCKKNEKLKFLFSGKFRQQQWQWQRNVHLTINICEKKHLHFAIDPSFSVLLTKYLFISFRCWKKLQWRQEQFLKLGTASLRNTRSMTTLVSQSLN